MFDVMTDSRSTEEGISMRMSGLCLCATIAVMTGTSGITCGSRSSFSDPQGNRYRITVIGEQVWMADNLLYDTGDGCYCYDDDPVQCEEMGRIYTWEAALKAADAIPGWHLPSKEEWEELINHCGADSSSAYFSLVSDSVGFNPQPSGVRVSSGEYKAKGMSGANYWSSSASDTSVDLSYSVAVMGNLEIISPHYYPRANACSVRLVKDR
jgi:uncharacterized protein (TIGR02145 family)